MSDIECDILIVGSGVGGLSALIAARMAGLKALLVEKSHRVGGDCARSSGMLWLPNNPLMLRQHAHDSREAALAYLGNFVSDFEAIGDGARQAAFVDGVAPFVAMLEMHGVPLLRCAGHPDHYDLLPGGSALGRSLETPLYDTGRLGRWRSRLDRPGQGSLAPHGPLARGSEMARVDQLGWSWEGRSLAARLALRTLRNRLGSDHLVGAGAALAGHLLEVALRLGGDIRTNAGMVELVRRAGRVSGAMVDFDGWTRMVNAPHGVIVATGDAPAPIAAMARQGAALRGMDEAWWVLRQPGSRTVNGSRIVPELHKPNLILVDRAGRRFVNEANDSMQIGRACRALQPDGLPRAVPAFAVMDGRHRHRFGFGPGGRLRAMRGWQKGGGAKAGQVMREATLAGLARQCGFAPGVLEDTVARWNALCETGVDADFGKGASAYNRLYGARARHPNPCMGPIARPPFFALPLEPGDTGTCGGAVVDSRARVLREDGSAVDGLHAVGNCTIPLAGPHHVAAGQNGATAGVFAVIAVRRIAG